MLELSLLHQFVAVADTENVGAAAQRLHMSASPLSRRIRQLEAELGLRLFEREKQRLRLTPAGRAFVGEARSLLASASRLEARAREAGAGLLGSVRVGFVEGAVHAGVLPRVLRDLRRTSPGVRVELVSMRSAQQLAALLTGEIDAGFVYGTERVPQLRAREVLDEPFVLVVPRRSALARSRWRPKQLSAAPFLALPEHVSPHARRELLAACGRVGLVPDIRYEVAEPSAILRLVAADVGVAIVQASLAQSPGIAAVELPPAFGLRLRISFVTGAAPSPLARRLLESLVRPDGGRPDDQ